MKNCFILYCLANTFAKGIYHMRNRQIPTYTQIATYTKTNSIHSVLYRNAFARHSVDLTKQIFVKVVSQSLF